MGLREGKVAPINFAIYQTVHVGKMSQCADETILFLKYKDQILSILQELDHFGKLAVSKEIL